MYDYKYIKEIYNGEEDFGYLIDELENIPNINTYLKFKDKIQNEKYHTKIVNQERLIKFLLGATIELQRQIDEIKGE